MAAARKKIRCAIYTRKSSEEGLDQDFNSLDAQREACAAYIASQKHEGWILVQKHYDDGGISGGTLDRPALKDLMADIEAGKIDQIVVYKIDRLTRSLTDFAKLVETLDAAEAGFVSVTQSFNTTTSMGRLTLNVLLSFAQFEREVTAERIRDKIAASKQKGLWMGGVTPIGYEADGRTLKIIEDEAQTVRTLYHLYLKHGTVREVTEEVERLGLKSATRLKRSGEKTGGLPLNRGHIHQILTNPIYAGLIRHKNTIHEGQHDAIIDRPQWDKVQEMLASRSARPKGSKNGNANGSALCGKFRDETGDLLTPSHATKDGKRYRYYVSSRLVRQSGEPDLTGWRLPAKQFEGTVRAAIADHIRQRDLIDPNTSNLSALEYASFQRKKLALAEELATPTHSADWADLINSGSIAERRLMLNLCSDELAKALGVDPSPLSYQALHLIVPLTLKRRGVETRIILNNNAPVLVERDEVLIKAIATAQKQYEAIKSGKTIIEIAKAENISLKRIRQTIKLAFLAPSIVEDILAGKQPSTLTTDWLIRNPLPACWGEQQKLIQSL